MAERSQRMRVGMFVAASLVALSGLVVLFGGRPTFFTSHAKYAVVFPEAPGVAPGTPVRKSGVRIGEVTGVELDDESGRVRVSVELDPKYLPRDSEDAVITKGLLSGDTTLDFVPKDVPEGTPPVRGSQYPPGSDIPGLPPVSPGKLLNRASDVLPSAQESLQRLTASLQRFEKAVPKVERTVDEFGLLARSGREFIPELRQTNTRVQDLLGAAVDPDDPQKQVTVRDMLKEMTELLRAIKPVADDIRSLVKDNREDLNAAIRGIRQTTDSVNDVLNAENKRAIAGTLKNVQTGTDDLVKTIRLVALFLDQGEKLLASVNARVVQAERILANFEKASKPIADNVDPIVKDMREAVKNFNAASTQLPATFTELQGSMKQLGAALKNVSGSEGSLGKVLNDPTLYNNLNDSIVNLNRVLIRTEKIARDLEVFADKVARKPELVGVGGALRPSTGLKESPVAPLPQTALPPVAPVPTTPTNATEPPLTPFPPSPLDPVSVPSYRPTRTDRPPLP